MKLSGQCRPTASTSRHKSPEKRLDESILLCGGATETLVLRETVSFERTESGKASRGDVAGAASVDEILNVDVHLCKLLAR